MVQDAPVLMVGIDEGRSSAISWPAGWCARRARVGCGRGGSPAAVYCGAGAAWSGGVGPAVRSVEGVA